MAEDSLTRAGYELQMPRTSLAKCKGYAFVAMRDPRALTHLADALWQQRIPTRQSARSLKIHPAEMAVGTGSYTLRFVL